jgi:hypothetical protein
LQLGRRSHVYVRPGRVAAGIYRLALAIGLVRAFCEPRASTRTSPPRHTVSTHDTMTGQEQDQGPSLLHKVDYKYCTSHRVIVMFFFSVLFIYLFVIYTIKFSVFRSSFLWQRRLFMFLSAVRVRPFLSLFLL